MFVIVAGNVIDGVNLIGPFEDSDEANLYGDAHVRPEWVVATLEAPVADTSAETEAASSTETRTLRIVSTDSHDHVAVFLDGEIIYCHDYNTEGLILLARHLNWNVQLQSMSGQEFERTFG